MPVHVPMPMKVRCQCRCQCRFRCDLGGGGAGDGDGDAKIECVVVAEEYSQPVREAAVEMKARAEERDRERDRAEALLRWNTLLRSMKATEVVRRKYGGLNDGRNSESQKEVAGSAAAASFQSGKSEMGSRSTELKM